MKNSIFTTFLFIIIFSFSSALTASSNASVSSAVGKVLLQEYVISEVIGASQCLGTVASILDEYDKCDSKNSNINCANIAARHIAKIACKSYCKCS